MISEGPHLWGVVCIWENEIKCLYNPECWEICSSEMDLKEKTLVLYNFDFSGVSYFSLGFGLVIYPASNSRSSSRKYKNRDSQSIYMPAFFIVTICLGD